jgi:transposase
LHVLRSGCCWRDCPPEYAPATTIYNRYNRWNAQGVWKRIFERLAAAGNIPDEISIGSTYVKAHRSAAGQKGGQAAQAIGRSGSGRTSKIHAVAKAEGKPLAFIRRLERWLTSASLPVCSTASPRRVAHLPTKPAMLTTFASRWEEQGTEVVIPSTRARRRPHPLNRRAYRGRDAVERMFERMKDWRRLATRYDRLARNFLSAIALLATAAGWLT